MTVIGGVHPHSPFNLPAQRDIVSSPASVDAAFDRALHLAERARHVTVVEADDVPPVPALTWISVDVGVVRDPTVVAVGWGTPGIDDPLLVLSLLSAHGGPAATNEQADMLAQVYRRAFDGRAPHTEVFDKTGFGLPLWQQLVARHGAVTPA